MPVDISGEHLVAAARQLAADYPLFPILPVIADYTRSFELPLSGPLAAAKRVVFFPGSTIGNLDRAEAGTFLRRMTTLVRRGGGVIVGVDLKKDKARLEAAYDDPGGVTAAFNMNLPVRMNGNMGACFVPGSFPTRPAPTAHEG